MYVLCILVGVFCMINAYCMVHIILCILCFYKYDYVVTYLHTYIQSSETVAVRIGGRTVSLTAAVVVLIFVYFVKFVVKSKSWIV